MCRTVVIFFFIFGFEIIIIFYSKSSTQYLINLNSKKIVHCANFPRKLFDKKKIPQQQQQKKSLKKSKQKIEHNEALILFYKHNSLLLSLYYQVRKPPPRVCHSFNEKKKPAKKRCWKNPGNGNSF